MLPLVGVSVWDLKNALRRSVLRATSPTEKHCNEGVDEQPNQSFHAVDFLLQITSQ